MSLREIEKQRTDSNPVSNDVKFAFCCTVLLLLSLLILHPGFATNDTIAQLIEARNGIYSDWHPPIMAWIWRHMEWVVRGSFGMLALQLSLLWLGLYLVAAALISDKLWVRVLTAACLFLFPPVLAWSGAIVKDTLMIGAALVGAGALLRAGSSRTSSRWALAWFALAVLALSLVCSVRHNGFFLIPGLVLMVALLRLPRVGIARVLLEAALILFLPPILGVLANHTLMQNHSWPLSSLLSFDVAGIAARQLPDPQFEERFEPSARLSLLRPEHRLAEIPAWYDPIDWLHMTGRSEPEWHEGPVVQIWTESRHNALKSLWWALVRDYPRSYIAHRLSVAASLLSWGTGSVIDPVCMSNRGAQRLSGIDADDMRSDLQRILGWRLDSLIQSLPVLHPWFFYLSGWLLLAIIVLDWHHERRPVAAGLLISGLLHESALFFVAPAAEYRYSAWMMLSVTLAAIAVFLIRQSRASDDNCIHQDAENSGNEALAK